jgi:hypothetical protein
MPMQVRRVDATSESSRPKTEDGARPRRDEQAVVAGLTETDAIDVQTLLHLQRTLGNQAVAELLARQRRQAPAVQRRVPSPTADPKFQVLTRDVRGKQRLLHAPTTGRAAAGGAQAAAHAPPDDREAQAKTAQSGKMAAAKPGAFDKAAFIAAVDQAIAAEAPKTLDDADKFASSGKADHIKGAVRGQVTEGKQATAGPVTEATKAAPDLSVAKDKPVTPLSPDRPPGTPAAPNPSQAVPDRAPASATDFSAGPKQINDQMAQAGVTEEQLKAGNEPEFDAALGQKKELEDHSATAPGQVRASESKTLEGARAEAATTGAAAMSAMAVHRVQAGQRVGEGQQTTKDSDETKRAQVTATLQKVFDATKQDVEGILSGLDHKVDQQFDADEGAARKAFEADMQKRMDAYKEQRYGGFMGKLRWVKDQFAGLPPEANQIFVAARDGYVASMRQVISRIADTIGAELTRAKARIAQGRADLEAEVHKLPADLQALGQQAAAGFESQFDELNSNVDAKGQELVQTLADKYTEALKTVDAEIDEEKAKNQGLVAKAVGAIQGVIQTIIQLKDLLMGVLAKAAQAVTAIIKDPIGFLGHLVSAVGAGLKNFIANIADHLKKGLVSWLMGAAAQAGLQLPDKFDLKGIIQLVAGLLGLTWQAIRGRIVSRGVPDQAITAAEQAVPEAQLIAREGLPGLWQQIVSKIGDIKSMLLGKLADFLIPTVLVAGITWIVSLLNPASAFVKAVKAIIDIVTFIFERGAQILEFVSSVEDAIIAIAGGGVAGVPALIENALAKSIPVLIGFLAALLGVGGITDKVKEIIQAISRPITKVIDWVVDKIVGVAKKFWAKLKARFGKKDEKPADGDDLAGGLRAAHELLRQGVPADQIQERLPGIKARYRLANLDLVVDSQEGDYEVAHAVGTIQRASTPPEKVPKTAKPAPKLEVDSNILAKYKKGFVYAVVTQVGTSELGPESFVAELSTRTPTTVYLRFDTFGTSWREYRPGAGYKIGRDWLEIKNRDSWDNYDDARQVLSFRASGGKSFRVPAGKNWHHIIEQSLKGPNSVENLGLVDWNLNQVEFKNWFGRPQPGTGGLPLRQFLDGKSLEVQKEWGLRCIHAFRLEVYPVNTDLGTYQEIR